MSMSYSRASRLASICHKEFDFQFFVYQEEVEYKTWMGPKRILNWFHEIADNIKWNCLICILCLIAIIVVAQDKSEMWERKPFYERVFDITFNVVYLVHCFGMLRRDLRSETKITFCKKVGYLIDLISYSHYISFVLHMKYGLVFLKNVREHKSICYYLRLHRPLKFLILLSDNNLLGSVVGTTLKYVYIFCLLRVTFALLMIYLIKIELSLDLNSHVAHFDMYQNHMQEYGKHDFLWCIYLVDKLFMPIGPQVYPFNDLERLLQIVVMITGTLTVTGIAIATMSIVMSVYLQHQETYRSRFKLIVQEMKNTKIPANLRDKVETFYRMYWHKQKGVSGSVLMYTFPPTTYNLISSEIYFEAQQKSLILRDCSNQFLSEISKLMVTINYIPGDSIIKRKSTKSSIIYISYGDVEMMSAEDDMTPMLRFSRGTILNGCGGCPAAACAKSHVEIRAATFCTAHVLTASDLWKVTAKFGRANGQAFIISSSFQEHFERVRRHHARKKPQPATCKSSVLFFKRNLVELKEARDAKGKLLLARNDYFLEIANCYIIRNRADSSLTDDSDRICMKSKFPCILQPTSSLLVAWSGLVSILTLITSLIHPYKVAHCYAVTPEFRFFDYVVSLIFMLDIITYLSIGANIEEGVPITFKQTSTRQMKSFWFALDVIAVLPIFELLGKGDLIGLNKIFKLPKVFKVLKDLEEVAVYYSNILRFVSYVMLLIVTTYLLACLQQAFMCYVYELCEVTDLANEPFWGNATVNPQNEQVRFLFSLYWAVSVMGFIMHKTAGWNVGDLRNRIYVMAVMEGCMVLRVFTESVYSATIMVTLAMQQQYETCITDVKKFLIRNNVNPVLCKRFIGYLQLCWHTDKAYSITHKKQSVLFDLPPHVSSELLAMQRIKYIAELPFAKYIKEKHLNEISSHARLFHSCPNEILMATGDVCNEMYVIKQGFCEVLSPDTKDVIEVIGSKKHFGVLECLLRIPAFYTVRAVTHVQMLSIHSKDVRTIIALPNIKDAIRNAKTHKEYRNLTKKREAFVKFDFPPPIPNRSTFPLPRKHEPDVQFLLPFQRLGLLAVLRYVFPRWTIRPDGRYMQRYEWFRAICSITVAFVFPCYLFMSLQFPFIHTLATFLDFAAYFDIIQRALVAYYDDKGILVYHPASTAAHYFKGAFLIDLLGALPLEFLDKGRSTSFQLGNYYRITNASQDLACVRLLQLYRLPSALKTLSAYIEREDVVLIIKGVPLLMALLNLLSSGLMRQTVDIYAHMNPGNATGEENWMLKIRISYDIMESPFNLHLTCYFWAVYETTSTGFNIINPTNMHLTKLLFIGNLLAMMLTTYFSVRVISIRANVNQALAGFQEHMRDIRNFMKRENVTPDVYKEVIDYYSYNWDKTGGLDYSSMFKLCDQITLRTDAIMNIYGPTFNKCPVLNQCDLSLLRLMGRAVHSVYLLAETTIILRYVIDCLYFIAFMIHSNPPFLMCVNFQCPVLNQCDLSLLRLMGRAVHSVYFLAKMTITLRDDVIDCLYFIALMIRSNPPFLMSVNFQCPVLNQCDLSLLRLMGRAVHSVYFLAKMTITLRDDVIDCLYFIALMIRSNPPFLMSVNFQCPVLNQCDLSLLRLMGRAVHSVYFLAKMTITLRDDVIDCLYFIAFMIDSNPSFLMCVNFQCPVLNQCDLSLLRLMGRAVHSVYFLADTTVILRDDVIDCLYFVDYGTIEVKDPNDDVTPVTKLPRGSIFGNLTDRATMRSKNSFVTNNNVHLLKVNTEMFYQIIGEFPVTKKLLLSYLTERENYIIGGQKDPTRAISVWKERTFSTAILIATRKGIIKYFDTHSKFMQIYLVTVSLLSIYMDTYNVAFQDNGVPILCIVYILDVLFLMKLFINYAMTSADCDKEIKLKLLKQRKIYFQGVFKYDIISCLPIELFCFAFEPDTRWEAFSFLRLNRVFRAMTINECIQRHLEKLNINLVLSTLASVSIWFTVFMHSATCIWHYIGVYEERLRPNTSWFSPSPDKPPCQNMYLCALYFTLTTFTQDGVGDIMPKTVIEVIFTCILQIISTMLYMIYVGEFSNIIQYQSFRFFSYYTQYTELMEYLKFNRVTKNLVEMMNRYTLHLWRESRGVQMPYLLETAPQCLQTKVMSAAYMMHLTNHPIFRTCEPTFLRQLVRQLKMYSYFHGMYVVKENEITDSMYMIHTGSVEEVAEDLEEQTQLLHEGDNFGIAQGLQQNTPFIHSYRAVGKAKVLTLRYSDWNYLLKHFPKSRLIIYKGKGDEDEKEEKERKRVQIRSMSFIRSESAIRAKESRMQVPPQNIKSASVLPSAEGSVPTTPRTKRALETIESDKESIRKFPQKIQTASTAPLSPIIHEKQYPETATQQYPYSPRSISAKDAQGLQEYDTKRKEISAIETGTKLKAPLRRSIEELSEIPVPKREVSEIQKSIGTTPISATSVTPLLEAIDRESSAESLTVDVIDKGAVSRSKIQKLAEVSEPEDEITQRSEIKPNAETLTSVTSITPQSEAESKESPPRNAVIDEKVIWPPSQEELAEPEVELPPISKIESSAIPVGSMASITSPLEVEVKESSKDLLTLQPIVEELAELQKLGTNKSHISQFEPIAEPGPTTSATSFTSPLELKEHALESFKEEVTDVTDKEAVLQSSAAKILESPEATIPQKVSVESIKILSVSSIIPVLELKGKESPTESLKGDSTEKEKATASEIAFEIKKSYTSLEIPTDKPEIETHAQEKFILKPASSESLVLPTLDMEVSRSFAAPPENETVEVNIKETEVNESDKKEILGKRSSASLSFDDIWSLEAPAENDKLSPLDEVVVKEDAISTFSGITNISNQGAPEEDDLSLQRALQEEGIILKSVTSNVSTVFSGASEEFIADMEPVQSTINMEPEVVSQKPQELPTTDVSITKVSSPTAIAEKTVEDTRISEEPHEPPAADASITKVSSPTVIAKETVEDTRISEEAHESPAVDVSITKVSSPSVIAEETVEDTRISEDTMAEIQEKITSLLSNTKVEIFESDSETKLSEAKEFPSYLEAFEETTLTTQLAHEEGDSGDIKEPINVTKPSERKLSSIRSVSDETISKTEETSHQDAKKISIGKFEEPVTKPEQQSFKDDDLELPVDLKLAPDPRMPSELKERDTLKKLFSFGKKPSGFTPPAGPSLKDAGPPIELDTNLWPIDSRRRSSESVVYDESDDEEIPKKDETHHATYAGRKSTVYGIKRDEDDLEDDDDDMGIPKHFVPLTIEEERVHDPKPGWDKEEFERELAAEIEVNLADHDVLKKEENMDYLLSPIEPKEIHVEPPMDTEPSESITSRKSVVHGLEKPKVSEAGLEEDVKPADTYGNASAAKSALKKRDTDTEVDRMSTSFLHERGKRKSLAQQLVSAAKKFINKDRMSILEEKDALMIEQEAQATKELLNKPRSQSEVIFKRQQSVAGEAPKAPDISDFDYKTYDVRGHSRKSVLAFKDDITTFEVSQTDLTSVSSEQKISTSRAAGRASMLAYADDIAMKQPGVKDFKVSDDEEDHKQK